MYKSFMFTLISLPLRFFDPVLFEEISQFAANLRSAGVFIHFCHSCCRYKIKKNMSVDFPYTSSNTVVVRIWYDMQKKDLLFTQIIEFSKETGC